MSDSAEHHACARTAGPGADHPDPAAAPDPAFRAGRRAVLRTAALGLAALAVPLPALAARSPGVRTLSFHHLHTGERRAVTYFEAGRYERDALAEIARLLRDFRTGEVHPIDRRLLDLLHGLRQDLGLRAPFEVISGFRSPRTNAALARASHGGVAVRSLHMFGQAIDVRVPGLALARLRSAGLARRGGGVGYYPEDGFVHLDVGRVRQW